MNDKRAIIWPVGFYLPIERFGGYSNEPGIRPSVHPSVNIFSSPGRSPERATVLPPASALALASAAASVLAKCLSFYVKGFYVMGKAQSGKLSCPCDRSCCVCSIT